MTPEQALVFIDNIVSQVPLSRKDHSAVVQAFEIIKKALKPND